MVRTFWRTTGQPALISLAYTFGLTTGRYDTPHTSSDPLRLAGILESMSGQLYVCCAKEQELLLQQTSCRESQAHLTT